MPIEIRELNITASVTDDPKKSMQEVDITAFRQKILAECIEEVLRIMEEKKER